MIPCSLLTNQSLDEHYILSSFGLAISLITIPVAATHTIIAPHFASMTKVDTGRRNSNNPMSLFPNECSIDNLCNFLLAIRMPVVFITAIIMEWTPGEERKCRLKKLFY